LRGYGEQVNNEQYDQNGKAYNAKSEKQIAEAPKEISPVNSPTISDGILTKPSMR